MTAARLEESLREDVEAALAEAALAQERQQLLQLEVTDLQRQRNELAARGELASLPPLQAFILLTRFIVTLQPRSWLQSKQRH
jgi:hypothetical protein